MAEDKTYSVEFRPDGVRIDVPFGTTVLDAARRSGVFIDSLCGGEGACGKCRVIIRSGEVEGGSTDFFTRLEIREGYVLACDARVAGDLVVEVPPESRLRGRSVEVDIAEQRLTELPVFERRHVELNPPVKRYSLHVPEPSLEYNKSDLERLEHALKAVMGPGEFQMGLKVIRTLPGVLRHAGASHGCSTREVTATAAHRGSLVEITEVVSGKSSDKNLALALDVGTTTVVAHLVDLSTGTTIGRAAKYNSQISFGADVIHRIIWCTEQPGGLQQLHDCVIEDVNTLIRELVDKLRVGANDITFIMASGNTTMMHILLGVDPQWIRKEPYVGVTYLPPPLRAVEVGLAINPRGLLYSLPCVSAFVGADMTAGVMTVGLDELDRPHMLIDIGTNGEIVIGNKDWMVCASASAGPAFEGAGTLHGMRAMRGAIDHIEAWSDESGFAFTTIGNEAPVGLCGTAYVDLMARLLAIEAMDKTGRLDVKHASGRVRMGPLETPEFVVAYKGQQGAPRDITITQNDLASLMRTKAAIYAAAKVLLKSLNMKLADLSGIFVAGAFGNFLDVQNAVSIGLLPDLPPQKIRFVRNTSVGGAKLAALDRQYYSRARRLADGMTYFELSTDPHFMEEFTSACFFPHTNIEEFPSVLARQKRRF